MSSACMSSAVENIPAGAWDLEPGPLGPYVSAVVRPRREASGFREAGVVDDARNGAFHVPFEPTSADDARHTEATRPRSIDPQERLSTA